MRESQCCLTIAARARTVTTAPRVTGSAGRVHGRIAPCGSDRAAAVGGGASRSSATARGLGHTEPVRRPRDAQPASASWLSAIARINVLRRSVARRTPGAKVRPLSASSGFGAPGGRDDARPRRQDWAVRSGPCAAGQTVRGATLRPPGDQGGSRERRSGGYPRRDVLDAPGTRAVRGRAPRRWLPATRRRDLRGPGRFGRASLRWLPAARRLDLRGPGRFGRTDRSGGYPRARRFDVPLPGWFGRSSVRRLLQRAEATGPLSDATTAIGPGAPTAEMVAADVTIGPPPPPETRGRPMADRRGTNAQRPRGGRRSSATCWGRTLSALAARRRSGATGWRVSPG